ncbi:hypothetical protein [Klebsiella aerogenes]|uniref:hypothetical protein n=1 Tax=Klebsiella aerogenes TaxID=548 RepID=UPI002E350921|nr:hypothetical protein [Klebsiella aerogenes]
MRLTARKKQILEFYEPECRDWVKGEIGSPPFDVSGVAYLLHQMSSFDKKHQVESTRRTLESMVKDGLLEKVTVYERRQNRMQYSGDAPGVRCMVSRYGLPDQCSVTRDDGEGDFIEGECARLPDA